MQLISPKLHSKIGHLGEEAITKGEIKLLELAKDNDNTIGFVYDCLLTGVIDMEEINRWAEKVIGENEVDNLPNYIFDLVDFKGTVSEFERLLGFYPYWKCTKGQDMALYGILLKRGESLSKDDVSFSEEQALKSLENIPKLKSALEKPFHLSFFSQFMH